MAKGYTDQDRIWLEEHVRKMQHRIAPLPSRKDLGDAEPIENVLQGKIQKWAKDLGYPCQ